MAVMVGDRKKIFAITVNTRNPLRTWAVIEWDDGNGNFVYEDKGADQEAKTKWLMHSTLSLVI